MMKGERELIKDFLRALAACLREQLGEEYPLYFGRVLQGAKRPCLLLEPPKVKRQKLAGGRVQREYAVDLRFYPAVEDVYAQQQMGERLICVLDELFGEERNYRGRELEYAPGEDYLLVRARYDVITLQSLENAEKVAVDRNVMLEFGFEVAAE